MKNAQCIDKRLLHTLLQVYKAILSLAAVVQLNLQV